jgi:hypothetical protein
MEFQIHNKNNFEFCFHHRFLFLGPMSQALGHDFIHDSFFYQVTVECYSSSLVFIKKQDSKV